MRPRALLAHARMPFELLFWCALAGCDKTETVTRVVNLHLAPSCPIPKGSFGHYVATGDYEPPSPNQSMLLATDQPGQSIDGVPGGVQSLALVATPPDETSWLGVTLVPSSGDVDMLLLPSAANCSLSTNVGFNGDMVFAAVSSRTLLATGATVKQDHPSFRVDLATGRIAPLTNGITQPRVRAAASALGDGRALVSGGVTVASPIFLRSAQLFDEATGDFAPTSIDLAEERADHGSVTLESGDVLLAGGQNLNGRIAATERIHFDTSSAMWRTNEGTTPALSRPRTSPTVLRLADGSILIGGGIDGAGPVPLVEFFSPDASDSMQSVQVPVRATQGFVALGGGGALFVAKPDASDPPDFQRAWFVAPGIATPIVPDITAPLTDVKLFPRAGGGALLWTGTTWLVFDPWNGFSVAAPASSSGPDATSLIVSADPGLRAWVDVDGTVSVWRDSIRNEFATDDTYLTARSGTNMLAPERFPPPAFDATTGLALEPGEGAFVADARYADFTVDVDASDAPPLVVLRTPAGEIVVGGPRCPYSPTPTARAHVHVERRGAFVSFSLGGLLNPCTMIATNARVSVGIRGGEGGSHALNFSVARGDGVLH